MPSEALIGGGTGAGPAAVKDVTTATLSADWGTPPGATMSRLSAD